MKLKKLFVAAALALGLGVGAVAGISANRGALETKAAVSYSGKLVIKDNVGWYEGSGSSQAGKAAVYLWNGKGDSDPEKLDGWTKSFSLSSGTGHVYLAEYSGLSFEPVNMIVVRLTNSAGTNPTWSDQAYGNQTWDYPVSEASVLKGWNNGKVELDQWSISASVYTSADSYAAAKASLPASSVELIDGNPQVSGSVNLAKGETFKIYSGDGKHSVFYDCPESLNDCFSGGSKTSFVEASAGASGAIVCEKAGTYDFFYNTETKRVWISRDDIVNADGWATYFKANVGCDDLGVAKPTGWGLVSAAYTSLDDDTKDYIYGHASNVAGDNLAQALATYDWAIAHNPNLGVEDRFIVDSEDHVRAAASLPLQSFTSEPNSAVLATVIVSVVAIVGVGGFVLLHKKKQF